ARSVDDPRVRVVNDGQHLALAARLNQIAHLARGEFIARLDADDLMHPKKLEIQVSFLRSEPAVDVVGTGMYILDGNGLPVASRRISVTPSARDLFVKGPLAHATVTGRRRWFLDYPYDETYPYSQDRELWCRAFSKSRFANLAECYYFCREIDSFSLSKAVSAGLAEMRLSARYGPSYVGLPRAGMLILGAALKIPAYAGITALGLQARVVRRRSESLTPEERSDAAATLAGIRATRVPMRPDAQTDDW
ncbi:glycosyltransferase, partial [candidate division WOR-3 bacterium]|nr:glycosyltransferase [candidate division WOR-3 bacterium]